MRTKNKKGLPEVSIHGDLRDVKKLVSGVGKKKSLVVFRDSEHDLYYLESKGKVKEIEKEDLKKLEKKLRLIIFQFFPSAKQAEKEHEETTVVAADKPVEEEKPVKGKKKEKKEGKVKKVKKEGKVKKEKKGKKAGKEEKVQKAADE